LAQIQNITAIAISTSPISVGVHKLTARLSVYQFTGRHYQTEHAAVRHLLPVGCITTQRFTLGSKWPGIW
jgi:hypothetical protein